MDNEGHTVSKGSEANLASGNIEVDSNKANIVSEGITREVLDFELEKSEARLAKIMAIAVPGAVRAVLDSMNDLATEVD